MDLERFRRLPVMGILRGGDLDVVEGLVGALVDAGLETLEITLNTPDALAMITRAREAAADRLSIGAGTVLDRDGVNAALAAGATFIVSPVLVPEVVSECTRRGVPAFPGALTPREIHDAARAGAAMVKVFPASAFGPEYFREVHGPFQAVELLACGGVRASNCAAYFAAGAAAVAFGGSVFSADRLRSRDYDAIRRDVAELVAVVATAAPGAGS